MVSTIKLLIVLLSLLGFLNISIAVKREDFKTCSQSAFCSRQRNTQPFQIKYRAHLNNVSFVNSYSSVQFPLSDDVNGDLLIGQIDSLSDSTIRFRIVESAPIRARYVPNEALVHDAIHSKPFLSIKLHDYGTLIVASENYNVMIKSDPFMVMILDVDGVTPLISVNSKGLLNYEASQGIGQPDSIEPTRQPSPDSNVGQPDFTEVPHESSFESSSSSVKSDSLQQPSINEDDENDVKTSEYHPQCPEEFRNHRDSNPFCHRSVGVDVTFWGSQHVYGIPEHADKFHLRSTVNGDPYRLHNMDVCNYELNNQMALYGSVPVMIAHSENSTHGMFWFNAAETWIDIDYAWKLSLYQSLKLGFQTYFHGIDESKGSVDSNAQSVDHNKTKSNGLNFSQIDSSTLNDANLVGRLSNIPRTTTRWMSETGNIDIFFFLGPEPDDVFRQYSSLTGTTTIPPMFSLGYHQSRWNYFSQTEVMELLGKFEHFQIPLDVIWLDIEYTDGKRYFTWNRDKFPDPVEMTNQLVAKGRKLIIIVDPHIKVDSSYTIYNDLKSRSFFIKMSDGSTDFVGDCWPGSSSYIDFFNPNARKWYFDQYMLDKFPGTTLNTYLWNDMNEPSVFSGPEITINKDTLHYGGWENRDIHNIYGMLMTQTTYDALVKRNNYKSRPFVLSRAFFAGSQRAGAVWTGDNTANWDHLKITIPMMLSLSVVGLTFSGADVTGFFEDKGEPELFVRWYQAAAFQPFMRTHNHIHSTRREPFAFTTEQRILVTKALELRYAIIPFWYTLFFENELYSLPPMRPLWSVFPNQTEVFEIETSYMLGNALLVSPILEAKVTKLSVYLPGLHELWYDEYYRKWEGGEYAEILIGKDSIPRFQRGGTIIPYKNRKRRSTQAMINDPYTLSIALDKKNFATGHLFMDDGGSLEYRLKNKFYYRQFAFDKNIIQSRLVEGSLTFKTDEWIERIVIFSITKPNSLSLRDDTSSEKRRLEFEYEDIGKILTIRKPAVNANHDWTITIT